LILSSDELLATPPKQAPSLIGSGLLPLNGKMLLVAKTGLGKSVLALDIILSLILCEPLFQAFRKRHDTNGAPVPFFPVHQPCKVLYIDAEVGRAGLHQRWKTLCDHRAPGISLGHRATFALEHTDPLLLLGKDPKAYQNLRTVIGDSRPPEGESTLPYVVVLDPLGNFHEEDEDSNAMRMVFQRLQALQNEFHFACIIPHHESDKAVFGQMGATVRRQGTQKSRGHSSITQVMDTVMTLDQEEPPQNDIADLRLDWAKVRHGKKPAPGYLLVDYARMKVFWAGCAKGAGVKEKLALKTTYFASLPVSDSE